MSHTFFYKVTCDQDQDWTRICHASGVAETIKSDMEKKHAPNTYTINTVDLSGQPELAGIYCQMADITNPASNGEWT